MEENKKETSSLLRECQAVLTLYLVALIIGVNISYSTVAISGIQQQRNSTFTSIIPNVEASEENLSFFAGSICIGQLIGSLPGGFLGARIGPKKAIMFSSVPGIIGWILIATAPYLANLIIGRILCGISTSIILANIQALVAQYSSKERRGMFLSICALNEYLGITLTYSLAICLSWRLVALVPCVIYMMSVVGLWLVPESPIWLLGNKGMDEAKISLRWLRGKTDISNELLDLEIVKEKQSQRVGFKDAMKNLSRPDIYKPFLFVLFVVVGLILMGRFVIVAYAVQIFQKAGVQGNQLLPAVLSGAIQVVGFVVGFFLIQRLKRTTLAVISMSTCTLSMAVLGASLYLKYVDMETNFSQALPVMCVSIYLFAYSFGIGPLSMIWLGELIPPEYNILTGLIIMTFNIFMFITVTLFPFLMRLLHPHGTYWLFSGFCLVSSIFFLFVMPETKGLSILQIRQLFLKKNYSETNNELNEALIMKSNNVSSPSNTDFCDAVQLVPSLQGSSPSPTRQGLPPN